MTRRKEHEKTDLKYGILQDQYNLRLSSSGRELIVQRQINHRVRVHSHSSSIFDNHEFEDIWQV